MDVRSPARTLFVLALTSFSVLLSACPQVISLDYSPSTSLKGQGQIRVDSFLYAAAKSDGLRAKEIESNPEALGTFYMSQDIAALFTDAVKSELQFAGYEVAPDHDRIVTGVVEHFYYNWAGTDEKTFELEVTYTIRSRDSIVYGQTFRSLQRRPKALVTGGAMMKSAIKDCIEQFIRGAQEAKVL